MEKERKELYIEGVAIHGGPESCACDPQGRQRSVDRGTCGRGYRAAKWQQIGVPTLSAQAEGNTADDASASRRRTPRGRRTQCTHGISMHGNREIPQLARPASMMPRPRWFAGWQIGSQRAAGGTPRR